MALKSIQLATISPIDKARDLYEVTLHNDEGNVHATINCIGERSALTVRNALREHADRLRGVSDFRPRARDLRNVRNEAALIAALRVLAAYPLEDFAMMGPGAPDSIQLFGACDWRLTVGDVRKAREALAVIGTDA